MHRILFRGTAPLFLAALSSLLLTSTSYGVDLSSVLNNPSFEAAPVQANPGDVVGCPSGWTCGGSPSPGATVIAPKASQFAPGLNGLSNPAAITPNGVQVALCPTLVEGSCILSQTKLGNYVAGNTYTINLWVGTPATMPLQANGSADNVTPALPVGRATFYFTGNGVALQAFDINPPAPGQWKLFTFNFVPSGPQIGQAVGIMIFADSGGNDRAVTFDIASPAPPPVKCPTPPAGIVDMYTVLQNSSFESGNTATGSPISWMNGGSPAPGVTSYVPTAAQYVAGSDGLSGSSIVPDGKWVALTPTYIEGSGILAQTTGLGQYVAGTTYSLDVWVGTPLTMPFKADGTADNSTPALPAGRATFYWLGTGGAGLKAADITPPPPGQWKVYTLTFTPSGNQIGQNIGVEIFADSGGNDRALNIDTTCYGNP